jgi:FKBP-type peptidyl-prolyl cis-trans isomerase
MLKHNKNISNFIIITIVFIAPIILSCNNETQKKTIQLSEVKQTLKGVNKILVQEDNDIMLGYARRRGWEMEEDSTGMLYQIYKKGNGFKAEKLKFITLNYKVFLLDGTLCYSSDSTGSLTFRILEGGKESGLEYGVLKLREGDKARFIIPPYLAHGLLGDENKIPPRSIIIYDI